MSEKEKRSKKIVYLLVPFLIIAILFGYSIVSYLFFGSESEVFCMAVTRGCFLGTPLCVNFSDCELPPLWFSAR